MSRVLVALIVAPALTAFAPAPFPRADRERERTLINLTAFQGDWQVVSMEVVQQGKPNRRLDDWGPNASGTTGVRIDKDRWTYLHPNGIGGTYKVAIDASRRPAAIDWFNYGQAGAPSDRPGMLGLIRRDGAVVTILYYATSPDRRPKSFDSPENGWWVLTLRRQR